MPLGTAAGKCWLKICMVSKHFRGTRECWSPRTFRYSIYIRTVSSWLFLVHLNLSLLVFDLKMMATSGLDFFFYSKIQLAPSEILATLPGQFCLSGQIFFQTGQQQLWRASLNFKIKNSIPLFTIILISKMSISRLEMLVSL